jgi:hypothetical protein
MKPELADAGSLETGPRLGQRAERSRGHGLSESAPYSCAAWIAVAVSLASCAPAVDTRMSQPVDAMEAPWGPFARQCDSTRVSHTTSRWRVGETEVGDVYETCAGFSAIPSGRNAAQIAASVSNVDQPSSFVVLRMLRKTDGSARAAAPGDTGLLAQGSDAPDAADILARDIGLTARQVISPNETLSLPVRLSLPFPLDVVLSCRPDGQHRDRGRNTLVLSCTLDSKVRTDHLDAQVRLAGVEEIDLLTGIRLSSTLTGSLSGRRRLKSGAAWGLADDQLLYRRETEFE